MIRGVAPLLLALDTSTRTVGVALYDGAQVLSEMVWTSRDYHTVELAPAVSEALRRASVTMDAVAAVGVAIGPGSFTGLRVGLALAKGLVMARRLPLIGAPTLDALAAAQPVVELSLVATLRAGRGRLAAQWYQAVDGKWQPFGKVEVHTFDELARKIKAPTLVCGELTAEERDMLTSQQPYARLVSPAQSLRRPSYLAELAWKRWKSGQIDSPAELAPIYIHYNDPIPV
ncbi:MAG: tRNA (adenosine(37)-N6)-threonylcarbamoyltransferase complex dimerization subunit type 1 TsaB [Anaerolineales bacterium]|jgi:tRNA threonylcarbamoyladenosine biosynthesis protein TsaB|nr:tRNA (adenosine(37)-N6)-threonylcarbamoyltransferase complex dimerization subunit type 1 TsaB [Anaerolineales bacterium]